MNGTPIPPAGGVPGPDRTFNRIAGWASIIGALGLMLFFVAQPSEETKQTVWLGLGLLGTFGGLLGLLAVASLKYRNHYRRCSDTVEKLEAAVESVRTLDQKAVADKVQQSLTELSQVANTAAELHRESAKQLELLHQITPESQKLGETLRELKSVIPSASELAHELEALCGLFLQEVPGNRGQLRGIICTLSELTSLESALPEKSTVVIRRPEEIRERNNEELTRIMKDNATRGIKYSVIGDDMPNEWRQVFNLGTIRVDEGDSSLVLPSLGLVLYVIPKELVTDKWDRLGRPEIWYDFHDAKMKMGGTLIAGFVLLPIPHREINLQHGYLALRMSQSDIHELINRIYR